MEKELTWGGGNIKLDCEKVRNHLFGIFSQRIICRIGSSWKPTYNASSEDYQHADIAVYLHERNQTAVVWNLSSRRNRNCPVKTFSLSSSWEDIIPQKGELKAVYKKMGTKKSAPYEKILVLDIETLYVIADNLDIRLKINSDDKEFPNDLDIDDKAYDFSPAEIRNRVSTTRWERDRAFREKALESYGKKCAICRCEEEKLLEAAHIKSVAEGGTDDSENGICLCANHHIMFDKELIKINFKKHVLANVKDSVKSMPWYREFMERYGGKLIVPKSNKE